MKLKNFFGKILTVGAVTMVTLTLGAISIYAATTTNYIISDNTNITKEAYTTSSSAPANDLMLAASDDFEINFADSKLNTITVNKNSSGIYCNKEGTAGSTDGTLRNNSFTKCIFTKNGPKDPFFTIGNLSSGDIVEVYWAGVDSKCNTGKQSGLNIGSNKETIFGTANQVVNYTSYTVTDSDGDNITIGAWAHTYRPEGASKDSTDNRIAIFAIAVTHSDPFVSVGTLADKTVNATIKNVDSSETPIYEITGINVTSNGNTYPISNIKVDGTLDTPTGYGFTVVFDQEPPENTKIVLSYTKNGVSKTAETAIN